MELEQSCPTPEHDEAESTEGKAKQTGDYKRAWWFLSFLSLFPGFL